MQRLRLRQEQQQMIAIGVGAVRGRAARGSRAIRIGPWHDDDGDLFRERCKLSAGKPPRNCQHRLAAGRLIAVLQPDEPHDRPAELRDCGRIREPLGRGDEIGNLAPLLRLAE
jgi:hypothetical protein